jgi:uncharacterized membrane protein/predicted DsbA family dithiol-disulfide isomerase
MEDSLTLSSRLGLRTLSFVAGLGMMVSSIITVNHFYAANYSESIYEGSVCDINAFFNCDGSAFSVISHFAGIPLGYLGLLVGALVVLGALFPSAKFERTNKTLALLMGVVVLFLFSVLYLRSLCLYCSVFYVFALFSFVLFARYGIDRNQPHRLARYSRPSLLHLAAFGGVTLMGAYGFAEFTEAKQEAQSGGVAARVVKEFYNLPLVANPSVISPFWTATATEEFEDAPIRVIEYGDLLCPDCLFLTEQLDRLKEEFSGKVNIAFQFFPLEAACNQVVEKDKHPGACDLSYMSAYDPSKFLRIHDEIWANFREAKTSAEWRSELARRYGVEAALDDAETKELVDQIINTGMEYEKTSDSYSHGIRSTPTMILNNRMIIGTLPYEQLRAIFQALLEEGEGGESRFMENWVGTGP